MSEQPGFNGNTVVAFESRQTAAMAETIRRHGGRPVCGPSLREVPLSEQSEAAAFAERLLAGRVNALICTTGGGTRILLEALLARDAEAKILPALGRITLVARGPKPARVLQEWGVPAVLMVPEPSTWHEVVEAMETSARSSGLEGQWVAIQEYGQPNIRLVQALRKKGARVIQIPTYRWALPNDTRPLAEAIQQVIDGIAQVALFTNAAQVEYLLRFASEEGMEHRLKKALKDLVVASVGPATTEALVRHGIPVDFEPSHPRMEVLVEETARRCSELLREKQEGISRGVTHVRPVDPEWAPQQTAGERRNSLFLRACRREPTEATPVWIMRQAGRYLKEYRQIRQRVSFMELCKRPELAAEVTILAARRLKVDAAILFSDILLIVESLGLELEYTEGGPSVNGAIAGAEDVDRLREVEPMESLGFVFETVRLIRNSLDPGLPLIGFAGAPFTLAAYVMEGGASKSFFRTKRFMREDPGAWHALLRKISRGLVKYLNGQMEAGVDAIQMFDSWIGSLSPADYREFVLPHTRSVMEGLRAGTPVIHFGTGTAGFLPEFAAAGGDVVGVDSHLSLAAAWQAIGPSRGIQGNLDPVTLCAARDQIRDEVKRILEEADGRPGHIFNLGHGILPQTPEENAIAMVEYVHELSRR